MVPQNETTMNGEKFLVGSRGAHETAAISLPKKSLVLETSQKGCEIVDWCNLLGAVELSVLEIEYDDSSSAEREDKLAWVEVCGDDLSALPHGIILFLKEPPGAHSSECVESIIILDQIDSFGCHLHDQGGINVCRWPALLLHPSWHIRQRKGTLSRDEADSRSIHADD